MGLACAELVNIDPYWFAGFFSGEACFFVKIFKSNTKIGEAVVLTFQLSQHLRDEPLIKRLADYLGCGRISKNREGIYFDVTKVYDLTRRSLVIPSSAASPPGTFLSWSLWGSA